jgi:hypothetical protein
LRIREGRYAYDLEQPVDPRTQLRSKWRYTIFQVMPFEKVLQVGEADSREIAEEQARAMISRLAKQSHDAAA